MRSWRRHQMMVEGQLAQEGRIAHESIRKLHVPQALPGAEAEAGRGTSSSTPIIWVHALRLANLYICSRLRRQIACTAKS
jgi:hypothetical protein